MIKLNKVGRATKQAEDLLRKMNNHLDSLSEADAYRFNRQTYASVEELETAWAEMQSLPTDESSNSGVNGKSSHSEPKGADSVEDAKIESVSDEPMDSEIPESFDFDPNIGDTIKRGYNDEVINTGATETIGEPIFSAETTDINNPNTAEQPQGNFGQPQPQQQQAQPQNNQGGSIPKEKTPPVNPALNDADPKTKRIAAEQLVDTVLNVYDAMHGWAQPIAKIKPKRLNDLERKGLIDRDDTATNDGGQPIGLRELMNAVNSGIEEVLTPDPTFHAKVREPMIREFSKRGLGLTDVQQIAIAFGVDIGGKAVGIIQIRKKFNSALDELVELKRQQIAEMKEHARSQKVTQANVDSIQQTAPPRNEDVVDSNEAYEPITETQEVY